ncbi:MAG TPA: FAD-dependent oxidoreductase [Gaiellaceae bacterium]|nr:FAD-dependent oxidoreductase [Gaiellaceae bacterium]
MPEVAVVGAGVAGLAAAYELARAGRDVVVYEQFEVGHPYGSSHGRSRIFRLAYAEPEWVQLAQEALAGWRRWEADTGEQLLDLQGLLEIVRELDESSASTLERLGVEWERLDREEVERRFPVRVPQGSFAVFQPEAGIIRADRTLAALARAVGVREGTQVERLSELDADVVVCAAGSWARALLAAEGIDLPVRATRETVAYFRLGDPRPVPAVVSFKPDRHEHDIYALADPTYGLKVGVQHAGPEVEPGWVGEPDPELVARTEEWAGEAYRLAEPRAVHAETCLYTTTSDRRFVLERHGRIVVGSACSGHGFKFAPAIGSRLAELAVEGLSSGA